MMIAIFPDFFENILGKKWVLIHMAIGSACLRGIPVHLTDACYK